MKNILLTILIIILCLGCTRKQETEVVANDNENIAERVNYSINSTLHEIPSEGFDILLPLSTEEQQALFERSTEFAKYTIKDITDYIYNDIKIIVVKDINSLEEYLAIMNIPQEYIIADKQKSSFTGHSGDTLYEYIIITDHIKLTIWVNENIMRFGIKEIEIVINMNNYLHLFPYNTMDEYLRADNFGKILRQGIDIIQYFVPDEEYSEFGDFWRLEFNHGLLHSIIFVPFMT